MDKEIVVYPVILSKDEQVIFVRVPDIAGGFTQGETITDAIQMAEDLIGNLLEEKRTYPQPSEPQDIKLKKDESLVYVSVDLALFRRKYSRTIRKNVTIPDYLNKVAKEQNINVSQVLTEALHAKLGI